ncbi:ferritin-like domain-containing protein [Sodalis sp. RH22]|uniref:ferritin-like domain-containing protein n=1 Tax=unclassified Sodalis (in: enterobacteria) TaxID=2636512 RepID=UPI0039B5AF8B
MTYEENYHDWLRDAHAMEKQAESMLEKMAGRLEHYPDLKARLELHGEETRQQLVLLEDVIDRNNISRSTLKDVMGKMSAFGQAVGGMTAEDEVVKGAISGYVFEHFEAACYTSLIAAAKLAGDVEGARVFEQIREQELAMAEWAFTHLPNVTEQFMVRSATPDVEAKK